MHSSSFLSLALGPRHQLLQSFALIIEALLLHPGPTVPKLEIEKAQSPSLQHVGLDFTSLNLNIPNARTLQTPEKILLSTKLKPKSFQKPSNRKELLSLS